MTDRVLVMGASGLLGGETARRLLGRGFRVRAASRDPARLAALADLGAEAIRADLLDPASLAAACREVGQIYSTANGFMGRRAASPTRVDVPGYRNLTAAAKAAGVRRMVHVSANAAALDSSVDHFRVKAQVDEVIRASGVPFVLLRPSAFLDVWVGLIKADLAAGRPAKVFGDGTRLANYIAVADVAELAVRVIERPEVVNETIDLGGPSTISMRELIALLERHAGRPVPFKPIPRPVLMVGSILLRPFDELTARFMAMGAWTAAADRRLDGWRTAAERFGVEPMSAEAFLAATAAG